MITETDFFLVFGGFFSSPRRSVSAVTPILALMNGCSFMQEGRTDLKSPVWSPSAKDQGKMRAEGPLHKLSTSATLLHTQKWVCALEWYIYKEIQYQPYFPMAAMTNICPSPFHERNWEKLPSDLATGRHWGTWSTPAHWSKKEGFAVKRMWSWVTAFSGVPLLCNEKGVGRFLTKLLKEELLYLLATCTYSAAAIFSNFMIPSHSR